MTSGTSGCSPRSSLERAFDLGSLGRSRCVGEGWLVADGRDVAHVCMVAQAAAIMRRRTSGRMPPWRRYSASAGESIRASTSKTVVPPSSAVASTVSRWCGCDAAGDAADREALAAVEAERGRRLAVDVLERKHAHARRGWSGGCARSSRRSRRGCRAAACPWPPSRATSPEPYSLPTSATSGTFSAA